MNTIPQRRKDDRLIHKVGRFFFRAFFMFGVAAVISIAFFLMTLSKMFNYVPPTLPDKILLQYTVTSDLVEVAGKPSLSQPLLRPAETLHEIIDGLDDAGRDARVKGILVRLQDPGLSLAQVQELRAAVHRFRAAGKFAVLYADDIGSLGGGMADYYLAAAFDDIWLQPLGGVSLSGIALEVPFVKGALDKIGVSAQFAHQGKYKSAPESLTSTGMSAESREMTQSLVDDLYKQVTSDIAADRKLTPGALTGIVNGSPFLAAEAATLKLVDHVGYDDEALKAARDKAGLGAEDETTSLPGYALIAGATRLNKGVSGFLSKLTRKQDPPSALQNKKKIALIFGSGEIVPYGRQTHAALGEKGMAAEKIVAAFKKAMDDEDVAAIVFRVDSPGGAPGAADSVHRAVMLAQEKGKPVIVSMGSYAASGGYWIAAPARKIVAQPATLTGSIGVFGGKFSLEGLWSKLGISWEAVSAGDNARMWSSSQSFTPEQLARFDAQMKKLYDIFIDRVATGRKLDRTVAAQLAEGRVYTGRQALDNKLVDALGGIDTAVNLAKAEAGIDASQDVPIVRFPRPQSTLESFISLAMEGAFAPFDLQAAVRDALMTPVVVR
jgi:protease-4